MYYDGFKVGLAHYTLNPADMVCYEQALIRIHHNTWPVVNNPYNNAQSHIWGCACIILTKYKFYCYYFNKLTDYICMNI